MTAADLDEDLDGAQQQRACTRCLRAGTVLTATGACQDTAACHAIQPTLDDVGGP